MDTWNELLEPLLTDLPTGEQRLLLRRIEQAHGEQLDRKLHPRRRRRRNGRPGPLAAPESGA